MDMNGSQSHVCFSTIFLQRKNRKKLKSASFPFISSSLSLLFLFLFSFITFLSSCFFPLFPLSLSLSLFLFMLMDTAHWPQFAGGGVVVKQMEGGGSSSSSKPNNNNNNGSLLERKARPQKEQALNCPRCNSTNTKFCYYNNYSLSQPRYFCKACRRYWTEGGSLRNVPVGGGSRKNKRSSHSSSAPVDKKINASDQNPKIIHHAHQDLNLAIFPPNNNNTSIPSSSTTTSSSQLLGSLMAAAPAAGVFNGGGGFGLNELKPPSLSFSLEGFENGGGYGDIHHNHHHHHHHHQDQTAVMFPIEDFKQSNGTGEFEQNRGGGGGGGGGGGHGGDHNSGGGFWNGMLGGGSWKMIQLNKDYNYNFMNI